MGEHLKSYQGFEAEQVPKTRRPGEALDISNLSNVIELSDDEEETHEQKNEYEFSRKHWFYWDPQGQIQGPVSRNELKVWSDAGYFSPDFKVWKDGETPDHAILLKDMLSDKCS